MATVVAVHAQAPEISSVIGLVNLLNDENVAVQSAAVQGLLEFVDHHWHEVSERLATIEGLASDSRFPCRKIASLLASKVMYNLELLDDAVSYAMAAEDLFDSFAVTEYSRTIVAMAVQGYCAERLRLFEHAMDDSFDHMYKSSLVASGRFKSERIDIRLESLVERMVDNARKRGDRSGEMEAIGVALESLRLDKIREIIVESLNPSELLRYCVARAEETLKLHRFRQLLFSTLVEIYDEKLPMSNREILRQECGRIARILFLTGQSDRVAELLHSLLFPEVPDVQHDEDDTLRAYQIAIDLVSFEDQPFLTSLLDHPCLQPPAVVPLQSIPESPVRSADANQDQESTVAGALGSPSLPSKDTDTCPAATTELPSESVIQEGLPFGHTATMEDESAVPLLSASLPEESSSPPAEDSEPKPEEPFKSVKLINLRKILNTEITNTLTVDFLHGSNHTDLNLLDQIKSASDNRSSIIQNAIVISHALMQAGTTCDSFLRQNLDWLGKAVCWSKFTAAASTGVLHRGHFQASRQVLSAYLPGSGGGPYSEGGALYGLGMIHANRCDNEIRGYLLEQLNAAEQTCPQSFEPLQHGACLGLGLVSMSTGDSDVYAALREILFTDSSVAGEPAALAMGLVAMGTASESVVSELLGYAHDTEHDRIIRGAALGVTLCLYRKEDEADPIIDQMAKDKEPMLRYAAMFGLGLAYVGTANSSAVRRLLHVAVSDLSNDVRRAAVIALGFLLCNVPNQVPRTVSLLADSFNPYVRYAAALAVGIGCCGTISEAAVDLLLPMTQDTTDFVRQGALLALGLVCVQASITALPDGKIQKVRDLFVRVAADKHEDGITRFGAVIAQGLIDAGGRNSTIGFFSSTGCLRPESSVGFLLFAQLWYWYPYVIAISLAFKPTALIGLTVDLEMPSDFEVLCTAPPSKFAYVEAVPKVKKEEKKETMSAVLSAAQRRRQREQMKRVVTAGNSDVKMLPEMEDSSTRNNSSSNSSSSGLTNSKANAQMMASSSTSLADEKKIGEETDQQQMPILKNPCRVVAGQEPYMRLSIPSSKWVPIDPERRSGVVMLRPKKSSIGMNPPTATAATVPTTTVTSISESTEQQRQQEQLQTEEDAEENP